MTNPISRFLKAWKVWGLPAFAAVLLPWQEKITEVSLVSEYFQPGLNVAASVIGPLVALVTFASFCARSRAAKLTASKVGMIVFIGAMLVCLALIHTLGLVAAPAPLIQISIWVIWSAIYLSIFAAFAVAAVAGTLALPNEQPDSRISGRQGVGIDRPKRGSARAHRSQ